MDLDETEKRIMDLLKNDELSIDEISRKMKINVADLSVKLSMMSMKDYVSELNGKFFCS